MGRGWPISSRTTYRDDVAPEGAQAQSPGRVRRIEQGARTAQPGGTLVKDESVDPEALAAFLAGRLSAEEREAVFERLSRSQGDYEALVEAMRISRDLEAEAGAQPPLPPAPPEPDIRPARRFPRAKVWIPIAAVLAGAFLAPRLIHREDGAARGPVELLDGASLVRSPGDGSMAAALGAGWHQPGWSGTRGSEPAERREEREFRTGVRLVDVEAALDAQDADAVRRVRPELTELLAQLGARGSLVVEYERMDARAREPRPALERDRARAAAGIAELFRNSLWFDLGVWIEQARLAALAERTTFFDARAGESLNELIARVAKERGEEAPLVRQLRLLHALIEDGASPAELAPIRSAIAEAIRESGG